jgi:hypothetical protein
MLAKAGKRARPLHGLEAVAANGKKSEFGKSTAVFGKLQELQDQAKVGAGGCAEVCTSSFQHEQMAEA